jgi:hypothetical protein
VKRLLQEYEDEVHKLARALAEKGELEAQDVARILNGKLPARTLDHQQRALPALVGTVDPGSLAPPVAG